jgi:uncharacterized protein (TIGR00369 family)
LTSDLRPAVEISGRRFTFEPHHCFACGELNEHGLHLVLHAGPGGCWTELALDDRFQGWDGVAHGGILCTILDEVMAWSMIARDTWGVTARMAVDFRRPVAIGRRLRAEGTVTEASRRLVRTEGRLLDAETGELLVAGTGTFMAAPPERLAELKARYRLRAVDPDGDAPGLGDRGSPNSGAGGRLDSAAGGT